MFGLIGLHFVTVAHEIEESDVTDFQDPTVVDGGERPIRRSAVVMIESTILHEVERGCEVSRQFSTKTSFDNCCDYV